jgi:hypothetical protein
MAELEIVPLGGGHFRVKVDEGGSCTTHDVAVPAETLVRLGWSRTPEDLLRHSFEFLLQRESQTSILPSFTIDVIGRYFPEWESEARGGF